MLATTPSSDTASKLYQRLQTIAQPMIEPHMASSVVPPVSPAPSDQFSPPIVGAQSAQSNTPGQPPAMAPDAEATPQQPLPYNRATAPQESAIMPGMYKPLPEELLLEWIAPSRPFRKPNRRFFTTITMIAVLIGLILFFANQILPVAVVIAVVFLAYVLFSIPPSDVRYRLTTYGIRIEDQLYYWEELGRFWFTQQYEIDILHIEVARFPNTIHLLLGDIERSIMQEILSEVLLFERPPLTPVEKAGKWLQEKVPLDLES